MGKIAVYESWKDNRKFTKKQIKHTYNIGNVFEYYCDYVKSRTTIKNRKNLDRLKKDIKANIITTVMIQSASHVSRDMQSFISFVEFASNNNCEIVDINGMNYTNFFKFHKKAIKQTIKENKQYNSNDLEGVSL